MARNYKKLSQYEAEISRLKTENEQLKLLHRSIILIASQAVDVKEVKKLFQEVGTEIKDLPKSSLEEKLTKKIDHREIKK